MESLPASVYPAAFLAEAHALGTMLKMRCAMVFGCPHGLCIGLRNRPQEKLLQIVVFHTPDMLSPLEIDVGEVVLRRLLRHSPADEVFDPDWLGAEAIRQALTWHDRAHREWIETETRERIN